MKHLLKISVADFWLIFRDASLRTFLFLPILIFVVILWALPALIESYPFFTDFTNYIVIVSTIQLTQMFGFIYGMMLVDEKETGVAKVYGVIPVNKISFIIGRFFMPMAFTITLTLVLLMVQPFYNLSFSAAFLFSLIPGLMVPVYAIAISLLSKNRIEGLVWVKIMNLIIVIPILSFFVPQGIHYLFGIIPTFWVYQGLEQLIQNQTYFLNWLIGLVFFVGLLGLVSYRFSRTHYA